MSAPRYGPGELTLAQAEITLARAAAIRDLMQTGATHDEARAAVDDALRVALAPAVAQVEVVFAGIGDALDRVADYVNNVLAPSLVDTLARVRPLLDAVDRSALAAAEPGHPVPDDDRWAAALAAKRAGRGSGPRPPRMDGRRAA